MLRKLRIKFVCINMFIVTAMLCVIFALVLNLTQQSLEEQSTQALKRIASNSMPMLRPGHEPGGGSRTPYFIVHISSSGEILTISSNQFDLTDQSFLEELLEQVLQNDDTLGVLQPYALRYLRTHSPIGEKVIFVDISGEIETMKSLLQSCLLIGALSFAIFLVISILLAHWAVKPVDKAWQQQKQFTADASHELKTPLTVIMTNAELLQSPDYSEQERKDFVQSIVTMSHQMRGLVEQLLSLARIDNGAAQKEMTRLDYSELTLDALMPFEALFFEKGLTVTCNVQDGIFVSGAAPQLTQVAEILLDNAQKYAHPSTNVVVTLQRSDRRHCQFSVTSTGDVISQEDLKNIFKRFYRVDKARSRNGSYGLGLAIASDIVSSHRGKIWAESRDGVNTFFVQLPLV